MPQENKEEENSPTLMITSMHQYKYKRIHYAKLNYLK